MKTKTPKFTDAHRYPKGYRPAAATDIKATFRRIEAERKAQAEATAEKVTHFPRSKTK